MEIDIVEFKRLVNKLPNDGKIIIQITKDFEDVYGVKRLVKSNKKLYGFRKIGKVLLLEC